MLSVRVVTFSFTICVGLNSTYTEFLAHPFQTYLYSPSRHFAFMNEKKVSPVHSTPRSALFLSLDSLGMSL